MITDIDEKDPSFDPFKARSSRVSRSPVGARNDKDKTPESVGSKLDVEVALKIDNVNATSTPTSDKSDGVLENSSLSMIDGNLRNQESSESPGKIYEHGSRVESRDGYEHSDLDSTKISTSTRKLSFKQGSVRLENYNKPFESGWSMSKIESEYPAWHRLAMSVPSPYPRDISDFIHARQHIPYDSCHYVYRRSIIVSVNEDQKEAFYNKLDCVDLDLIIASFDEVKIVNILRMIECMPNDVLPICYVTSDDGLVKGLVCDNIVEYEMSGEDTIEDEILTISRMMLSLGQSAKIIRNINDEALTNPILDARTRDGFNAHDLASKDVDHMELHQLAIDYMTCVLDADGKVNACIYPVCGRPGCAQPHRVSYAVRCIVEDSWKWMSGSPKFKKLFSKWIKKESILCYPMNDEDIHYLDHMLELPEAYIEDSYTLMGIFHHFWRSHDIVDIVEDCCDPTLCTACARQLVGLPWYGLEVSSVVNNEFGIVKEYHNTMDYDEADNPPTSDVVDVTINDFDPKYIVLVKALNQPGYKLMVPVKRGQQRYLREYVSHASMYCDTLRIKYGPRRIIVHLKTNIDASKEKMIYKKYKISYKELSSLPFSVDLLFHKRYAIIIPSGGGKTTLAGDSGMIDIDNYLKDPTLDAIKQEILLKYRRGESVDWSEHNERVKVLLSSRVFNSGVYLIHNLEMARYINAHPLISCILPLEKVMSANSKRSPDAQRLIAMNHNCVITDNFNVVVFNDYKTQRHALLLLLEVLQNISILGHGLSHVRDCVPVSRDASFEIVSDAYDLNKTKVSDRVLVPDTDNIDKMTDIVNNFLCSLSDDGVLDDTTDCLGIIDTVKLLRSKKGKIGDVHDPCDSKMQNAARLFARDDEKRRSILDLSFNATKTLDYKDIPFLSGVELVYCMINYLKKDGVIDLPPDEFKKGLICHITGNRLQMQMSVFQLDVDDLRGITNLRKDLYIRLLVMIEELQPKLYPDCEHDFLQCGELGRSLSISSA